VVSVVIGGLWAWRVEDEGSSAVTVEFMLRDHHDPSARVAQRAMQALQPRAGSVISAEVFLERDKRETPTTSIGSQDAEFARGVT